MKVISQKAKKAIWGDLLIILLLMALIGVCIWRLFGKHSYVIMIVIIGILCVAVYWLVREIIILITNLKRPKDLLFIDEETLDLKFYYKKDYMVLKNDEINAILPGSFLSSSWMFYAQSIVIRTENKSFAVNQIESTEKALDILEEYYPDKVFKPVEVRTAEQEKSAENDKTDTKEDQKAVEDDKSAEPLIESKEEAATSNEEEKQN